MWEGNSLRYSAWNATFGYYSLFLFYGFFFFCQNVCTVSNLWIHALGNPSASWLCKAEVEQFAAPYGDQSALKRGLAVGKGQSERGAAPELREQQLDGQEFFQQKDWTQTINLRTRETVALLPCPRPARDPRGAGPGCLHGCSWCGVELGQPWEWTSFAACPVTASLLPSRDEAVQGECIMAKCRSLSAMAVRDFMHGFWGTLHWHIYGQKKSQDQWLCLWFFFAPVPNADVWLYCILIVWWVLVYTPFPWGHYIPPAQASHALPGGLGWLARGRANLWGAEALLGCCRSPWLLQQTPKSLLSVSELFSPTFLFPRGIIFSRS